jgi:hypothetical protein
VSGRYSLSARKVYVSSADIYPMLSRSLANKCLGPFANSLNDRPTSVVGAKPRLTAPLSFPSAQRGRNPQEYAADKTVGHPSLIDLSARLTTETAVTLIEAQMATAS